MTRNLDYDGSWKDGIPEMPWGLDDPEAPDKSDLMDEVLENLEVSRDSLLSELLDSRFTISSLEIVKDLLYADRPWASFIKPQYSQVSDNGRKIDLVLGFAQTFYTLRYRNDVWGWHHGKPQPEVDSSVGDADDLLIEGFGPESLDADHHVIDSSELHPSCRDDRLMKFLDHDLWLLFDAGFNLNQIIAVFESLTDAQRFVSEVVRAASAVELEAGEDELWYNTEFEDLEHFVEWIRLGLRLKEDEQRDFFLAVENASLIKTMNGLGFTFKNAVLHLNVERSKYK
jgi:hypothetical protein